MEGAPRDPDAAAAIAQGLRRAPNAIYSLVQTVLLQDEALKRAHDRIEALEANGASEQQQSGDRSARGNVETENRPQRGRTGQRDEYGHKRKKNPRPMILASSGLDFRK